MAWFVVLILIYCTPAYGHEGILDPLCEQNTIDIRTLHNKIDGKASLGFVKSNSVKVDRVQDSQAYTMAYIKVALGILGFAVISLSGLLAYVLRRLFSKKGE